MKKTIVFCALAALAAATLFAQSNANDTQAAIVNSLLIQQLMQMQQDPTAVKKSRIESEADLLDLGYKRFKFDEDAEDNIVIKNPKNAEYEIEVWAVNNRNLLSTYGTILVAGKKGYKGNPLDDDLDNYKAVWFKVLNDDKVVIKNLGEKWSDQYFEIQ